MAVHYAPRSGLDQPRESDLLLRGRVSRVAREHADGRLEPVHPASDLRHGQERMLTELGQRFRDVGIGPDGLIYALTDETLGAVIRIEPGP